jgi:hypothetical protein
MTYPIWATAFLLYLLFLGWHENWHGALTAEEIDGFSRHINASTILTKEQQQTLIDFMESDTGDEFFMLNLVAFYSGEIAQPGSGEMMPAPVLLDKYFRPFMGKILRRGGYPAFTAGAVGGYIEAWASADNPGWSGAGLIRYRSRRDLLLSITDSDFSDAHVFKKAALQATLAMPTQTITGALISPRLWVGFLILALAALAQIMVLVRKG